MTKGEQYIQWLWTNTHANIGYTEICRAIKVNGLRLVSMQRGRLIVERI